MYFWRSRKGHGGRHSGESVMEVKLQRTNENDECLVDEIIGKGFKGVELLSSISKKLIGYNKISDET